MAHLSENSHPLTIHHRTIDTPQSLYNLTQNFNDVCLVVLPAHTTNNVLPGVEVIVKQIANNLGNDATLIVIGEPADLVQVHTDTANILRYHLWIAIKRATIITTPNTLPHHHFGALVYTKYQASLRHTKTRIKYTYCPACGKTTKDYGGKKHTYHEYGTLMSDVWRDIACDLEGDITSVITRFSDLFGLEMYRHLLVIDCRTLDFHTTFSTRIQDTPLQYTIATRPPTFAKKSASSQTNTIIHGDSIEQLQALPDNSIDFIFTDPPYNLGKKYNTYNDNLDIQTYFEWCDQWLSELARILKPGRTLTLLNIPLWSIRHFLHLQTILKFQNWIVWDALSFPVRKIMPAHYSILAFSKGKPRPLPGFTQPDTFSPVSTGTFQPLVPLAEGFCLRNTCVKNRHLSAIDDRGPLTDLWWDIHRLKHNSRRVDHPTQLPPQLLYRLISIFSKPDEIVLDCFNGAGTTTLAAHQLGRQYIGIEKSEKYCQIAKQRHTEINLGLNPFRKAQRTLTAKNSRVPRLKKQKYAVSKKTLQLEVKRIAQLLHHLPTRAEVEQYGQYPIRYYDEYFVSWGEVCAAARTTGMSDAPSEEPTPDSTPQLGFNLEDL